MGFRYTPRVAIIEFDEPFAGLEIRAALDLPALRQIRVVRQLEALRLLAESGDESQAEAAIREAMELFVTVTDGWNYETDSGDPMPLSVDALLNVIPGNLAFQLTERWAAAVRSGGAPPPLEQPLPDGEPLEVPSVPTENA